VATVAKAGDDGEDGDADASVLAGRGAVAAGVGLMGRRGRAQPARNASAAAAQHDSRRIRRRSVDRPVILRLTIGAA
jgi:hypothetical protein